MWKPKIIWPTAWRPILLSNSKRLWRGILHVLLPRTCYACRRDVPFGWERPLCAACEALVCTPGPLYCQRCGKPLPDGGAHCYQCRGNKARSFSCKIMRSAVLFNPPVRALVHAFKYADRAQLSGYLAQYMVRQWPRYPQLHEAQLIIPVPLHAKKLKRRGYNQSALLARALARQLHLPQAEDVLLRVRNTPSQTEFGREGRLRNMHGAFACVRPGCVKGKIILLIDDVATTGATLEGCAEALKEAGAKKVMAYTLAREV